MGKNACPHRGDARCNSGLHVKLEDVHQEFTLDLNFQTAALKALREMEVRHPDEHAKYVRIVVYGFASLSECLLLKFLHMMRFCMKSLSLTEVDVRLCWLRCVI